MLFGLECCVDSGDIQEKVNIGGRTSFGGKTIRSLLDMFMKMRVRDLGKESGLGFYV